MFDQKLKMSSNTDQIIEGLEKRIQSLEVAAGFTVSHEREVHFFFLIFFLFKKFVFFLKTATGQRIYKSRFPDLVIPVINVSFFFQFF
jgi:hypothetical protein